MDILPKWQDFMDNSRSLVEFFYNIVPGALFIFLLQYFGVYGIDAFNIHKDATVVIFVFLVLALFLGFLFQGIVVIFRHLVWNKKSFKEVEADNPVFNLVLKTFGKKVIEPRDDYKYLFYLMDDKLRVDNSAFLPTHFSSLFAFWSNIFCACSLLLIVIFIHELCTPSFDSKKVDVLILIVFLASISWYFADKFLKSFYDTILNCYYMKFIKKENGRIDL